ncbi:hypothetical protein CSB20_14895 [bacterium DOLZORAL124_64_63]|nr:MAG: hypothetical protein CSB20_14895 [bacterium DOLZORAL124_64_63]
MVPPLPSNPSQDPAEVAGVLHDIRQMLMVITGRVGLLRMRIEDEDILADLEAIALAAEQTGEILARLRPGDGQRRRAMPGDLRLALEQTARLAGPAGQHPWIIIDTCPENPSQGSWDMGTRSVGPRRMGPRRMGTWHMVLNVPEGLRTVVPQPLLREVLNNLVVNALEAMPAGGRLLVACHRQGSNYLLTLRDTGPGIPEDRRAHIFAEGYTTSGQEGRGIGLAFSRDLLACAGGALDLCPPDGKPGACFRLTLPVLADAVDSCSEPICGKEETDVPFRPAVLVVDDEVAVREMLGDVLDELGCTVGLARDAQEAMALFAERDFGLAILDQSLPGLSGLDLADALRRKDPRLALVLMSGWGQKEILDKARAGGVDLVAEKPLTVEKIAELLDQAGRLERADSSGS